MPIEPSLIGVARSTSPQSIRDYAKANGWEAVRDAPLKGRFYLFRNTSEPLRQLIIPMDAQTREYPEMILDVAERISLMEKRPVEAVLNDLLLPNADILRFRLVEAEAAPDSIPLQDGINLLEGAKKALLAAACSVVSPQSHHPRMSRIEAEQLLGECKLGQTERGSYVVKIACPLDAVDPSMLGLEEIEPFVRRTTKLLLASAKRITDAIERDEVEKLYDDIPGQPVISSNLCDALLTMQAENRSSLSISAKWASTRPKPGETELPQEIQFNADYFPVVADIYEKLRPSGEDKESVFVATVETLNGDLGQDGKRAGDVGLWVFHEEETIPARVMLNAAEYEIADQAHMAGELVVFKGLLHRGRRIHKITNVEGFSPLRQISPEPK